MPRRTRADYESEYPGVLFHYNLSFRARHPSMPLKELKDGLRMRPGGSHEVGKPRRTPKGERLAGVYKATYVWVQIKTRPGEELPHAISRTINRLRERTAFLEQFRLTGGALDFFVGLFVEGNKGVTFDIELMRDLTEMGIDLGLDVYGSRIPSRRSGSQPPKSSRNRQLRG